MYHPLEVAEAEPTEAEDAEEVEEDDVGNRVAIKIAIVQLMEQHHHRPEEPHRRYRHRPPDRKTLSELEYVFQLRIRCARVAHQCNMPRSGPQRRPSRRMQPSELRAICSARP